jgi:hypothetical protein
MPYHVTPKSNLKSILKNGFVPAIGERSEILGEVERAVYFFCSLEECDNALWNWLGEEFEDLDEDLIIIEVDIDKEWIQYDSDGNVFYEIKVTEKINSDRVKRVLNEKYEDIKLQEYL